MNQTPIGIVAFSKLVAVRQLYCPGRRRVVDTCAKTLSTCSSDYNDNSKLNELLNSLTKMPKDEPHLNPLKQQRAEKKKQQTGQISHTASFQVMGNGRPGGVRSLCLVTNYNRYMFNTSEGTQRVSIEQGPSKTLSQLSDIFITKKNWQNMGGLTGVCLTARATGASEVRLHGPPGCMDLFVSAKDFVVLRQFDVISNDVMKVPHDDATVRVEAINIPYAGPEVIPKQPKYSEWKPTMLVHNPKRLPVDEFPLYETGKPLDQTVLSYEVTIKAKMPRLQLSKCLEAGVPAGPLLGKLKNGEDVTLENGKVVRAKDVRDPSESPCKVFIVDCPSEDYLAGVVENERLRYDDNDIVHYVFHFTPDSIVTSERYAKWMATFPDSVKHVIINEGSRDYAQDGMFRLVRQFHAMSPGVFPKVLHNSEGVQTPSKVLPANVVYAKGGADYQVRPKVETDESLVSKNELVRFTDESEPQEEEDRVRKVFEKAAADGYEKLDLTKPAYPKVTFLGTGSSVPSKYRNVTSILVETAEDKFILLDCGEGTYNQLYRHFGPERTRHVLLNMKAIFNSHPHSDHHIGGVNIIHQRTRAFAEAGREVEKLFLLTSHKLACFYRHYHEKMEPILDDVVHVNLGQLTLYSPGGYCDHDSKKSQEINKTLLEEVKASLGLSHLVSCRAKHCAFAYCIAMTTSAGDGYKLVFTGDTRPCDWLRELCTYMRPPDLLIHEGTLEHYQLDDAIKKMHSTFTEAIESGKDMKAGFTLVTHFSQRYSKFPVLDEFRDEENVGIAFDHMHVSPQSLHHIRPMYPMLEEVFKEFLEVMEGRQIQSLHKQGREKKRVSNIMKEESAKKAKI